MGDLPDTGMAEGAVHTVAMCDPYWSLEQHSH